jgi:hypothetical protein
MLDVLQQIEAKDWALFLLGSGTTVVVSMLRYLVAYLRQYLDPDASILLQFPDCAAK